jgi:hypothetical protein
LRLRRGRPRAPQGGPAVARTTHQCFLAAPGLRAAANRFFSVRPGRMRTSHRRG